MQIQALRHQIRKQDKKQELRAQEVKTLIQEQLKEKLARDMQYVPYVVASRSEFVIVLG